MRISDWSSDVCSSDLERALTTVAAANHLSPSTYRLAALSAVVKGCSDVVPVADETLEGMLLLPFDERAALVLVGLVGLSAEDAAAVLETDVAARSEEHTSELQSLMRTSYAVFCLKNKKPEQHRLEQHRTEFTNAM